MKLPWLTANEIIRILVKQGFTIRNQVGSHVHLICIRNGARRMVTVPCHGNREIAPGTLLSIIHQSGFSKEEFVRMME